MWSQLFRGDKYKSSYQTAKEVRGVQAQQGAAVKMDEGTMVAILNTAATTAHAPLAHLAWGILLRSLAQPTAIAPKSVFFPTSSAPSSQQTGGNMILAAREHQLFFCCFCSWLPCSSVGIEMMTKERSVIASNSSSRHCSTASVCFPPYCVVVSLVSVAAKNSTPHTLCDTKSVIGTLWRL